MPSHFDYNRFKISKSETNKLLNYCIEGEGPPLLLIHGFGVSFRVWQNLASLLRLHFQLIMLELPGINYSPLPAAGEPYYLSCANAIVELRESLGIKHWSMLSYSAGTRAGEAYMQRDAAHIYKAVFLCPAWVKPPAALAVRVLTRLNRYWSAAITWLLSGQRFRNLIVLLAFNGIEHPYVETWMKEIDRQPITVLKASLAELPGGGGAPFVLPSQPVCFIWGRHDIIAPPPRRLTAHDRVISANHAAPMLAASAVAEVILLYLIELSEN